MLGYLQSWITSIVAFAVIMALALALTPDGQARKTVRFCCGLVMILLLLRPAYGQAPEWEALLPETDIPQTAGSTALKELIEQRTSAYIVNKAQALGLEVTARVVCDEEGAIPVPAYAVIRCDDPDAARSALETVLAQELDIGESRQRYERR